MCDLEH